MKKIISIIVTVLALSMLISCSKNTSGSLNGEQQTIENQNVNIEDSNVTKPHTNQLNNAIFSIKPDDAFNGMYDTVIESNYIELYDLESRNNGNEGLLFAICAYKDPAEWAGSPSEKVGELKLNDGTVYDIIIGYPTESQFGFDREMPTAYKKLYDARYDIAKTVTGKNGEKIEYSSGAKGDNLYNDVLKKLIKGLDENWDANRFEKENMSPMYKAIRDNSDDYMGDIQYAYHDVNVDGVEELLIGEKEDGSDRLVIYDLYTMVDRKPAHVVSGWGRNRYYSIDGSFIANEYSNSAFESGLNVYALETNSTNLVFQLAIKYDSSVDEKEPWYVSYIEHDGEYDWDKISEKEYNDMQSRFDKDDSFPCSSLKDFK